MELKNETLRITFSNSIPLIKEYEFKPTKRIFKGQNESVHLIINKMAESWDNFEISQVNEENKINFTCNHLVLSYSISLEFSLHSFELHIKLSVDDPESYVSHISFTNYPLISILETRSSLTRQYWLRHRASPSGRPADPAASRGRPVANRCGTAMAARRSKAPSRRKRPPAPDRRAR